MAESPGPQRDEADDLVPASVRLGNVVPPEDPEDWTRPLTWVAALGMLVAPLLAAAWFLVARPDTSARPLLGTFAVAIALAVGASVTGATQIGALRAFTGTLGAGLFAALVTIVVGVVLAGERQVGAASPTLDHALAASMAGLAGSVGAAFLAVSLARVPSLLRRLATPALAAGVIAVGVVRLLLAP